MFICRWAKSTNYPHGLENRAKYNNIFAFGLYISHAVWNENIIWTNTNAQQNVIPSAYKYIIIVYWT